jgi:hypothetical protein
MQVMGTNFQRRVRNRKLLYAALIVILASFSSLYYRPYLLESNAQELALREEHQGEVDLIGATVRLSLTGSRGFAMSVLWYTSVEKRKKEEWNELEVLVKAISQLQPHCSSSWEFNSWDLGYNVSYYFERVADKYYWISRCIDFLAEGERKNRDHPNLRRHLAFFYANKIGVADQHRTLRSLFQMSCIDPKERDPANLRLTDGKVDLIKFQAFCMKYPHLVRRLRELQGYRTPEDVVQFLGDNWDIPSRYEVSPRGTSLASGPSRLKLPAKQFPVLPPPANLKRDLYEYTADEILPSEFDNYKAAQIWYTYAQQALPEPNPVPGPPERSRYRLPAMPIFRSYPALVQSQYAEHLQQEGWFNRGWEIDEGKVGTNRWFADRVVAGADKPYATLGWEKAYELWRKFGVENGQLLDAAQLAALEDRAKKYRKSFGIAPQQLDRKLRPADFSEDMRSSFEAHSQLYWYHENRKLSNFPTFYHRAEAERTAEAILAREVFFKARRLRKAAGPSDEILRLYTLAIPLWKGVLNKYPEFRKIREVQEFTYRRQATLIDLQLEKNDAQLRRLLRLQEGLELNKVDLKQVLLVADFLQQGALRPAGATSWLPSGAVFRKGPTFERPQGPFDGVADDRRPYLTPEAIHSARANPDPDDFY